jgi:hypothetical protein
MKKKWKFIAPELSAKSVPKEVVDLTTSMPSSFSAAHRQHSQWAPKFDHHLLHFIKIIRLDSDDLLPQCLLDLFHLQPSLPVMHKVYRNPFAAESAGATWG